MYDASIGRWHVKDPLGESMSNVSPYSYCFNNPLSFVDEYGLYPRYDWDMSQYYDDEEERVVSPEEFMFWLNNGRYPDQPMVVQDPFWSNMVSSGDLTSYRAEVAWFSGWYREDGSFYTVSVKYRLQENQIHANSDGGSNAMMVAAGTATLANEVVWSWEAIKDAAIIGGTRVLSFAALLTLSGDTRIDKQTKRENYVYMYRNMNH